MKRIKLFEQFVYEAEFPSALGIDDCVNFKPMARHAEKYCIDQEKRFGKVVAVRFTIAKVFYDILDDYLGVIFDGVDSAYVEPSESRKTLDDNIEKDKLKDVENEAYSFQMEKDMDLKELEPDLFIRIYDKEGDESPSEDFPGSNKGPFKVTEVEDDYILCIDVDGLELKINNSDLEGKVIKKIAERHLKKYI